MRTTGGRRCFHYTAARTWNNLPETVRSIETLGLFKKQLKKHLFEQFYCT